jgi:hypothetical protein
MHTEIYDTFLTSVIFIDREKENQESGESGK